MNFISENGFSLAVAGALCVCGGIAGYLLLTRKKADPRIQEVVAKAFSESKASTVRALSAVCEVIAPTPVAVPSEPLIIKRATTYSKANPNETRQFLNSKLVSQILKTVPAENLASVLAAESDPRRRKMLLGTFGKINETISSIFNRIERFRNVYVKKKRGAHFAFGLNRDKIYVVTAKEEKKRGATKEATDAVCLNNLEPIYRLKIPRSEKKFLAKEMEVSEALHKIGNPHLCLPFSCQMTSKTNSYILFQHGYVGSGEVLIKANPKQLYRTFCQGAEGLALIHEAGFVHSDFKPPNFLVEAKGEDLSIKITDFGTSRRIGSKFVGTTPLYAAPEMFRHIDMRTLTGYMNPAYLLMPKFDSFALGVTFLNLIQKEQPTKCFFAYSTREMEEKIESLTKDVLKRNIPDDEKSLLCGMISVCRQLLERSPSTRISCRAAFDFLRKLS